MAYTMSSNFFTRSELDSWRKWAEKNSLPKSIQSPQNLAPGLTNSSWENIDNFRNKNRNSSCGSCGRRRYL